MADMTALALVAAGLWWHRDARAQDTAEAAMKTWEFATLEANQEAWQGSTRVPTANICYHRTQGCRWETVRITVDRWGQVNDALTVAVARLGERGWEPVSTTTPGPNYGQSILFKRARPLAPSEQEAQP